MVEMNTIIICACLPMCYSFVVARISRVPEETQPKETGYQEINPPRPVAKRPSTFARAQGGRHRFLDDDSHHAMPAPDFGMRGDYPNTWAMVHVRGR